MRSFVKHGGMMHVPKSPVVIALSHKVIESTGSVVGVASPPAETRMQDTDVEHPPHRFRVSRDQIAGDIPLPETLTVERDADLLEPKRFGFFAWRIP